MREYEESHPWITFDLNAVRRFSERSWLLLGEAQGLCKQIGRAPLPPSVQEDLLWVSLRRGVMATTAIEGNTLSQDESVINAIKEGTYEAPPSRQYQAQEIENVLEVINYIDAQYQDGSLNPISLEMVHEINRRLLEGTEHEPNAVPGVIRDHSVAVGGVYQGAPHRDCRYLLERLTQWLSGDAFRSECPEVSFARSVIGAIYAHLYLAWIHPFGDGNGRTARMLEYVLLTRTGDIPYEATHLLWNHYYNTHDRYYAKLQEASSQRCALGFVEYAIEGFTDGLREHVEMVHLAVANIAWINHVHETMTQFPATPVRSRQRNLVLRMERGRAYSRRELKDLQLQVGGHDAPATDRTLSRDLARLANANMIIRDGLGWRTNSATFD